MNKWVIGTFVTKETPYEDVCKKYLIKSLDYPKDKRLKVKTFMLEIIPNLGNWNRNVAEKPAIILKQLEALSPEQCLVFVDADATFEQYPDLFDIIPENVDVAFHVLSWRKWYGYDCDTEELLSGTMFFRNNERVRRLCKEWHTEAVKSNEWEQAVLSKLISKHIINGLQVQILPIEYCFMVSRPGGLKPLVKCDPVILHHQKSRELKREL